MNDDQIYKRVIHVQKERVDMVLDTDTYNEIDDQFALCYALASRKRLDVQAVYAAPFHNANSSGPKDGMEKSYDEIVRLLTIMGRDPASLAYRGGGGFLPDMHTPLESPAAKDMIERAKAKSIDDPLYVVAIGAITNVASALLMEPSIAKTMTVIWLGGHGVGYPHTKEFNMTQDRHAANVLFDSRVPFVRIPCMQVASHAIATLPEIKAHLLGYNAVCDALVDIFTSCVSDHTAYSRVIWDITAVARLIDPAIVPITVVPSPIVNENDRFSFDPLRHPSGMAYTINRDALFKDLYETLTTYA